MWAFICILHIILRSLLSKPFTNELDLYSPCFTSNTLTCSTVGAVVVLLGVADENNVCSLHSPSHGIKGGALHVVDVHPALDPVLLQAVPDLLDEGLIGPLVADHHVTSPFSNRGRFLLFISPEFFALSY